MALQYSAPSKGQVIQFAIGSSQTGGALLDLTSYVHCIRVYEDICKRYITAQVIIYDNNNVIEGLQITAGCPATFKFWAPPNQNQYDASAMNLTVLKLKGEQMPNTLAWQMYYIDLIGPVYYQNRATHMTDKSLKGISGTEAIRNIWQQYLSTGGGISTFTESVGLLGTEKPLEMGGLTPFTGIDEIMKLMNSPNQTGNWLLFRDRNGMRLGQAFTLFNQAITSSEHPSRSFIQKETWGAAKSGMPWGDGFNDKDIYRAIIIAQMNTNEDENANGPASGGRASGVDIAATTNQLSMAFDAATGQFPPNFGMFGGGIASALTGAGGILGSSVGLIGGIVGGATRIASARILNSEQFGLPSLTSTEPAGAYQFAADVAGSPSLVVKVPMQMGINCTVGQGIYCQLIPPTGLNPQQASNIYRYLLTGSWLVTQLCHEIYTDSRESQATTVMKTLKGTIPQGS